MTGHAQLRACARSDGLCNDPRDAVASINVLQERQIYIGTKSNSTARAMDFVSHQRIPSIHSTLAFSLLLSMAVTALVLRKIIGRRLRPNIFPASTGLPPCKVPPHPLFGHMLYLLSPADSKPFRSVVTDQANSSGIATFWFFNVPSISVLKAEHARIVLRKSIERKGSRILYRHFKTSLGQDSLVLREAGAADKEIWRHHRNLMKTGFTKNAVDKMANKVWKVADGFASSILCECAKNQGSFCAEAADIFKWVTLDIFGRVAFDYNFGCIDDLKTTPLAHSLNCTVEDSNARCKPANLLNPFYQFYWLPTQRNKEFKRHSDIVHGLLREICQQRVRDIEDQKKSSVQGAQTSRSDDLLTALLKSHADSQDTNQDDSHGGLVKILLTLFFAGFDTSSILLSFTMWSVATHPEVQQECAREARDASKNRPKGEVSLREDASHWESQLAYCRAAILETLRLHPPAPVNSRIFDKDIKLDGHIIPKGARVYLPITQIHTDERNFARPMEFLPERWVCRDGSGRWVARDCGTEPKVVEEDQSYIPPANPQHLFSFSDGARRCIGHRLALQESTIVFANLVRDLTVNVPKGFVMQKRKKLAICPPAEMPLIFRKRE
eukprot:CAMPEP_0172540934 /NCGR_PEP_ID=MMETSP1067-20121228/11829_1 /TAXON_ID=265564 ORGANISM="Thalassiosira punctigera, Strain Tpunct2005C2" /NCGR_SAMPLE_ID=MMETSP1067 /ASSEMBLY_ACC=CAM_ASM_000444 /LENGTH=610 /DNA_ID=CAMNT_0013326867 /DNA_START=13 /DNA_END=1842 /DNA_ORIENTATION=-